MSGLTRRGWLAGIVAAVAGWAGKLFGHTSQVTPRPALAQALLVRERRNDQVGPQWSSYGRLDGKLVVEPGASDGEFIVTIYDREGREVEHTCESLRALHLYAPHGTVEWKTYSTDVEVAQGQRTTLVYDGNGNVIG